MKVNRRNFVAGTAFAASTRLSKAAQNAPSDRIHTAIIGVGVAITCGC